MSEPKLSNLPYNNATKPNCNNYMLKNVVSNVVNQQYVKCMSNSATSDTKEVH